MPARLDGVCSEPCPVLGGSAAPVPGYPAFGASVIENPQASRRPDACSLQSTTVGEPMAARAGHTRLWVLVEHPGPWPKTAPSGLLPDALLDRIDSLAHPARLVLIRRPRHRRVVEPRWILAWSDGVGSWMREGTIASYANLSDLPFETSAVGVEPDVGTARRAPLFVVCTHGKKDACCAELGRPIVTALTQLDGADVWECTHIGGDRFAANLIAFPAGMYFSRLGAESAQATARDYLEGRMALAHLRGRAALPQQAQVAEHVIREVTGVTDVDALESVSVATAIDSTVTVDMRMAGRTFRVVVRSGPPEEPFRHGCIPGTDATWARWIVERLEENTVE
ncbi:sucrase ferredoxin [Rhodococcus sp. Q]|uniref:sucrase ferredoxin n=1 Tax=Rhodococcus sp. Q TaxID=2502252 RepID=UPI0020167FA5|nr:sucrase ferredoxin [Rhodococcus sp. Q]